MTASPLFESRFPVGSSASRMTGSPATARATATRCCWPPESWLGRCLARCAMPTRSSASVTRCRRSAGRMPRYVSGSSTFSKTVRSPIRLKLWKMNPISRLRTRARSEAAQLGDRPAVQLVRAVGGGVEQAENREQRRLAAARRPADRRRIRPCAISRLTFESACVSTSSVAEDLREVLKLDDRRQSIRVHAVRSY